MSMTTLVLIVVLTQFVVSMLTGGLTAFLVFRFAIKRFADDNKMATEMLVQYLKEIL